MLCDMTGILFIEKSGYYLLSYILLLKLLKIKSDEGYSKNYVLIVCCQLNTALNIYSLDNLIKVSNI